MTSLGTTTRKEITMSKYYFTKDRDLSRKTYFDIRLKQVGDNEFLREGVIFFDNGWGLKVQEELTDPSNRPTYCADLIYGTRRNYEIVNPENIPDEEKTEQDKRDEQMLVMLRLCDLGGLRDCPFSYLMDRIQFLNEWSWWFTRNESVLEDLSSE